MQRLSRFRWGLTLTIILLMALTFCLSYAINRVDNAPSNNIIEAASNNNDELYGYSHYKYLSSYIPTVDIDGHAISFDGLAAENLLGNNGAIDSATAMDYGVFDVQHPGGVRGKDTTDPVNVGATLYTGWQDGHPYSISDFSRFGGSANHTMSGGEGLQYYTTGVGKNKNSIYYRRMDIKKDTGYQHWMYFYGYIMLPNALTTHGGRITVSAETTGYHDLTGYDGYKFLSVVAGDQLGNNPDAQDNEVGYTDEQLTNPTNPQHLRASDIRMNSTTGRTNSAKALRAPNDNKGPSAVYFSEELIDGTYKIHPEQNVTIDIRPGDKYIRVSYISILPDRQDARDKEYYGQQIRNLNASYTLAPETNQDEKFVINDHGLADISFTKTKANKTDTVEITKVGGEYRQMQTADDIHYNYTVSEDGRYIIKLTDAEGRSNFREVTVSGIDKEHPVIVQNSIKGNDTNSIALSRTISFEVSDANTIARVEVKLDGKPDKKIDVTPTDGYKNYSFVADEKGIYRIHMTDKYGNKNVDANGNVIEGDKVTVKHILTPADKNVDIKIIDKTSAEITFTSADYNYRIADPQNGTNVTYKKIYNYGSKAKYKATYSNLTTENVDVSATIRATTNPIALNVTINGGQAVAKNYGDTYTATADKSKLADFIGWYNERGILVSDKADYSFKVVSNTTLTAKYVENVVTSGVEVKFINISNGLVDIRRYEDDADTIIDAITKHYNDPKDNLYDFAPKNAHMNFYRWRVVSDDKATTGVRHVTVSPLYSTNDRFIVKINGSEASNPLAKSDETLKAGEFYYNQKINLTGSTNGWAIDNGDGTYEIISSGDTTFHILNNTNFVKVDSIESGTKNNVGIDSSKAKVTAENDTIVITGSIAQDIKNVKEMGFIFVSATDQNITNGNEDAYIRLNTVGVTKVQAGNLSKTNQFLVNLNASAYLGAKVRAYYIDDKGNEYYSDIIVIEGNKLA